VFRIGSKLLGVLKGTLRWWFSAGQMFLKKPHIGNSCFLNGNDTENRKLMGTGNKNGYDNGKEKFVKPEQC
jgi:hypothetical protein